MQKPAHCSRVLFVDNHPSSEFILVQAILFPELFMQKLEHYLTKLLFPPYLFSIQTNSFFFGDATLNSNVLYIAIIIVHCELSMIIFFSLHVIVLCLNSIKKIVRKKTFPGVELQQIRELLFDKLKYSLYDYNICEYLLNTAN